MLTKAQIRQKLIGEVLPYVFIESVVLDKSPAMLAEDTLEVKTNEPTFARNEYGNNNLSADRGALEDREDNLVYKVSLKISINDLLNNSYWYNTRASTAMKIKIFQATSKEAFNLINSAGFHDIARAPESIRAHVRERVISVPNEKDLSNYAVRQIAGFDDTLCTIKIKQDFIVKSNYLGFVAFPFIDLPPIYGAKNSQKVLEGGKLNTKSYSYYSPDGSLWKGPVHLHSGRGVMEGKIHTQESHNVLTVVEHGNKLNDMRIFDKFSNLQYDLSLVNEQSNKRRYSDLLLSGDSADSVRGIFVFDYVGFLADSAEYSGLIKKRNLKKLMGLTHLQKLSIFRDRVNDYETGEAAESNVIGKSNPDRTVLVTYIPRQARNARIPTTTNIIDDDGDGVREKTIGSTKEVVVSGLGSKRAFSFVDHDMATVDGGTYIYGAEIEIKDPTVRLLNIQLLALREARKTILSYYEEARHVNNFDNNTNEFTYEYLSYLKKIYNLDVRTKGKTPKRVYVPWRLAPKIYFSALETLLGRRIQKADKKALQKTLYPVTGNLEGVERFISLLDSLIAQIGQHEVVVSEAKSRSSGKRGAKAKDNMLKSQRLFDMTPWRKTRVSDAGYRLNYLQGALSRNENSLVRINRNSLINRFNVEASKFFPETIGKRENQITNPDLKGFKKMYYSRLSPSVVETRGENIVVSRENAGSYEKAARTLKGQDQGTSAGATTTELLRGMGAIVKRRDATSMDNPMLKDTSDYLGASSNITNKVPNKSSRQDSLPSDKSDDPTAEKIRNTLLGRRPRRTSGNNDINKKDSLQERYIKLSRRESSEEQQESEIEVLDQTTVSVKYISGFDSGMNPIYSNTIPQSSNSIIYVLEATGDNSDQNYLINDSVGLVVSTGNPVSEEKLKDDDPCDDEVVVQEIPEASTQGIPTEEPCPEGYKYNYETQGCEPSQTKPPIDPLDDVDPPTQDSQPEAGQTYQEPPKEATPVQAVEQLPTVTVSATPVATSEQQQGYFVRRRLSDGGDNGY
jgi:hypothetical protein